MPVVGNDNHDPRTGEFTSGGSGGVHSGGSSRGTPSSTAEVARSQASTLLSQVVEVAKMQGGARVLVEGQGAGLGIGIEPVRGGMRSVRGHRRIQYNVGGKTRSREAWLDAASQLVASGKKPTVI